MTKAAKRKPKKAVVKAAPKPKPKPKRRQPAARAIKGKKMTDKDKDAKEVKAKEAEAAKRKEAEYANRDQDPNHPANKTLSPKTDPAPRPLAEGVTVPPEELLTEQEKDAVGSGPAGDTTAGVGPVGPATHTTGPVVTIEDQGIGPRTPYPTGDPPPDTIITTRSQGIRRGDEPGPNDPNRADVRPGKAKESGL